MYFCVPFNFRMLENLITHFIRIPFGVYAIDKISSKGEVVILMHYESHSTFSY